jgi:hypothetical protein
VTYDHAAALAILGLIILLMVFAIRQRDEP